MKFAPSWPCLKMLSKSRVILTRSSHSWLTSFEGMMALAAGNLSWTLAVHDFVHAKKASTKSIKVLLKDLHRIKIFITSSYSCVAVRIRTPLWRRSLKWSLSIGQWIARDLLTPWALIRVPHFQWLMGMNLMSPKMMSWMPSWPSNLAPNLALQPLRQMVLR